MVGVLIRMNLAAQGKLTGGRIFWISVGVLLALATLGIAAQTLPNADVTGQLLAAAFAIWTLGLALAPVFSGSGGGVRAEHLALLPIPPRKLAVGMLGAAVVSFAPAVALVAFAALALYGFQLGVVPGLVGIVVIPLQLLVAVLLARLVYAAMGEAMQTRIGMELVSLQFALLFAGVSVGWFAIQPLFEQTDLLMTQGLPSALVSLFYLLPTGWGLTAIHAASRAEWGVVAVVLVGFAVLIGGLLVGWSALLKRSLSGRAANRGGYQRHAGQTFFPLFRDTPMGEVIHKELLTWRRDPWRALEYRIAIYTGILMGVIPLVAGFRDVLPFAGIIIVLMGGIVSANLYALDGSALWQTLLTPNAERADVRGRQWAWLRLFAPVSLLVTVVFTALSGYTWMWGLVLALLPVTLGVNAGLVPLFSVFFPSPGIDPQLRRNPMDSSGGSLGMLFVMPIIAALLLAPVALIAIDGITTGSVAVQVVAIGVGILLGAISAWVGGWLAARRLQTNGTELLNLLLKGTTPQSKQEEKKEDEVWKRQPFWKRALVWICGAIFWLPLFPQGLVPLVMKLFGFDDSPSWFLALHLPSEWQFPVIFLMIAIGSALLFVCLWLPYQAKKEANLTPDPSP